MIEINNKKFLSYEEQVLKNKEDIAKIKEQGNVGYIAMNGELKLQPYYYYDLVGLIKLGEIKLKEYEIRGVVKNDGSMTFEGSNTYTAYVTNGDEIIIRKTLEDTLVKVNAGAYESMKEPETLMCEELLTIDVTKVVMGGE